MIRSIWKYPLKIIDEEQELMIPQDGKIVYVDNQNHAPVLWIEVFPKSPKEARNFRVFGTGHPIPTFWNYIGTCLLPPFVWHIYEWKGG